MVPQPLPSLEGPALGTIASAHRQQRRRGWGQEIASTLLGLDGGAELALVRGELDDLQLIDTSTGEVLEAAPGQARAARYAALLLAAAEEENHFSGLLQHEEQTFEAGGALASPSLRLDPNFCEVIARRSRKRAHAAMARVSEEMPQNEKIAIKKGYRHRLGWKFLTLTMPPVADATTELEIRRINAAWRKLGKKDIFRIVYGGIKSIENALDADGPHVHIHALLSMRYVEKEKLKIAWWESLDSATQEIYGKRLEVTADELVINIKKVVKKGSAAKNEDWAISGAEALKEICKYVTTPADYVAEDAQGRRIPAQVLLELCEIQRWPRMFELIGAARETRKAAKRASLDTSCISAAGRTWRVPYELLEEALEGNASWLSEALEPEEARKEPEKPPRPPTWRQLMDQLPLSIWLKIVSGRIRRARAYRIAWIQERNPDGMFATLDGKVYFGNNHNAMVDEM